jgi:hypothetical protein
MYGDREALRTGGWALLAAWLVGGSSVALAGAIATWRLRSWAAGWDYLEPYDRFYLYFSWLALVGFGAALVYLVAWVALPALPPYDHEGGLSILSAGRNPSLLDAPRPDGSSEAATAVIGDTADPPSPGVAVIAATNSLLSVLGGSLRAGAFLSETNEREASAVLGAAVAERLGVEQVGIGLRIRDRNFTVVGILDPFDDPFYRDLDESALMGFPAAEAMLGFTGGPDKLYLRTPWVAVRERRLDRLWRGWGKGALFLLMIAVAMFGIWRTLHPCLLWPGVSVCS